MPTKLDKKPNYDEINSFLSLMINNTTKNCFFFLQKFIYKLINKILFFKFFLLFLKKTSFLFEKTAKKLFERQ